MAAGHAAYSEQPPAALLAPKAETYCLPAPLQTRQMFACPCPLPLPTVRCSKRFFDAVCAAHLEATKVLVQVAGTAGKLPAYPGWAARPLPPAEATRRILTSNCLAALMVAVRLCPHMLESDMLGLLRQAVACASPKVCC